MAYYRINGGKRLEGAVTISGAKNAALAIIPAVILSGESGLLENLPEIEDVRIVEEILTSMGADISRTPDGSMRIDPSGIRRRGSLMSSETLGFQRADRLNRSRLSILGIPPISGHPRTMS